jgi:hypothetical protein
MLTSFDSVSGDVEYETQTGISHGATVDVYRSWSWPAQPAAGQRVINRTLYSQVLPSGSGVRPVEDRGIEFTAPPATATTANDQVTMVCFADTGQTGCGFDHHNTPSGTWSRFTSQNLYGTDVSPRGMFYPPTLAKQIASGVWQVAGRTVLNGEPAIELKETGDILEPLPVTLWVDAQTNLPIRLVSGTAGSGTGLGVMDFSFLPPTPANLALLQVPIPPGYPRR